MSKRKKPVIVDGEASDTDLPDNSVDQDAFEALCSEWEEGESNG